jgi:hypothetical protein
VELCLDCVKTVTVLRCVIPASPFSHERGKDTNNRQQRSEIKHKTPGKNKL